MTPIATSKESEGNAFTIGRKPNRQIISCNFSTRLSYLEIRKEVSRITQPREYPPIPLGYVMSPKRNANYKKPSVESIYPMLQLCQIRYVQRKRTIKMQGDY